MENKNILFNSKFTDGTIKLKIELNTYPATYWRYFY